MNRKAVKTAIRLTFIAVIFLFIMKTGLFGGFSAAADTVYEGCYGNQLDKEERDLYDGLVTAYITQGKTGKAYGIFTDPFIFSTSTRVSSYPELNEKIFAAVDAFQDDYPEAFWIGDMTIDYDISYSGRYGNWTGYVYTVEFDPAQIYTGAADKKTDFENAVSQAVAEIAAKLKNTENVPAAPAGSDRENVSASDDTNSPYRTIRAIHDYVCSRLVYDSTSPDAHSALAAFGGSGRGVCEGYAKAVKILCNEFEIPCACIPGWAGELHMWNDIRMEDGKWYLLDATWDDHDPSGEGAVSDTYFLVGWKTPVSSGTVADERSENTRFANSSKQFVHPVLSDDAYVCEPEPSGEPVKALTLSADPASPAVFGEEITLTAEAEGGIGPLTYTFTAVGPDDADTWIIICENSEEPDCQWCPNVPGTYTFKAFVTDAGDNNRETGSNVLTYVFKKDTPPEPPASVTGIEMEPAEFTMPAGDGFEPAVVISPANAANKTVFWKSSDPDIAAVDENGAVTAKKYGSAVITAITKDGGFQAACTVNVLFRDVTNPAKANFKAVYELAKRGIVKGYGSYFDVDGQCTRAQFVLFLWRYAGKPAPESADLKFSDAADIKALAPDYAKAIAWGNEQGIVKGFTSGPDKGKFLPNALCTRGQVVLFLWRYKGRPPVSASMTFKDAEEIKKMAPDYTRAIMWANSERITTGYSDKTFRPNRNCTRGECVTFLYRLWELEERNNP